jgi:DNA-directed RNA polymerase subunit RPC12/RpoP
MRGAIDDIAIPLMKGEPCNICQKTFYRHKCGRCTHEWNSTLEKPKRCPNCGNKYWNRRRMRCPECYRIIADDPRVEAGMKCGQCAYGEGEGPAEQEEDE